VINRYEYAIGRGLIAILFAAGAVQKGIDPSASQALLSDFGLPTLLIWPALIFNAVAAFLLVANLYMQQVGRALAIYCLATSVFHLQPGDPWQMSIMIKNWSLAGGCLILSAFAAKGSGQNRR
jgi:putative oxidoreductase